MILEKKLFLAKIRVLKLQIVVSYSSYARRIAPELCFFPELWILP